jgi:hypothetical protein
MDRDSNWDKGAKGGVFREMTGPVDNILVRQRDDFAERQLHTLWVQYSMIYILRHALTLHKVRLLIAVPDGRHTLLSKTKSQKHACDNMHDIVVISVQWI